MNDEIKLIGTVEAAELLKVHPVTLRNWKRQGIGPKHIRIGKHVWYNKEDVLKILRGE